MIAIIIFFAAFGPSMTPYTYESQIIEEQNLAPRIPGLENLGIFDGSESIFLGGREIKQNLYEKTVLMTFIIGSVPILSAVISSPVSGKEPESAFISQL
jgi:hypothetical protein